MTHDTITEQRLAALENALAAQRYRGRMWIAAAVLVAGVGGFLVHQQTQHLWSEIAVRPPVAVLDIDRHALRAIDAAPVIGANAAMISAQETAVKLAGQGYVVFHKNSVIAAPEAYEVP